MSLLELLVVVAILSALFGIGVGAFQGLLRPERLAADQIKDALRAARLFARSEGAPATVVVLPERGEVFALGLRAVGNWHFEDEAGTGWPMPALYDAVALVEAGVLGSGLRLERGGLLSLPSPPGSFDSADGFGVDVFLQPEQEGRPMTLLERPGSWALALDESDELAVTLWLEGEEASEEFRQQVPGARLPPDRATRLAVVFDGRALHVSVGGAPVDPDTLFPQPRRLVRVPGLSLGTGRPPNQFRGGLDELRVASVVRGEQQALPEGVALEGGEQLVRLDAFGRLDPGWHRTPVRIGFTHGEPLQRTVVEFGPAGTVRSESGPVPAAGPAPREEGS